MDLPVGLLLDSPSHVAREMLDGNSGRGKLTQGCGSGLLLGGMIYLGLASLVSELLSDSDSDETLIFLVVSTSGVGLFCLGMIGFVVSRDTVVWPIRLVGF